MRIKALLRTLHLWLGLALALWAILVALTGATLAYRAHLESWLNPQAYWVAGTPQPPNFDRIARELDARYPDRRIVQFHRNGLDPAEAMHVNLTRRITPEQPLDLQSPGFNPLFDAELEVFVDPATGAVLGEKRFEDFMRVIYDFHTTLLLPRVGKSYLGILGAGLFVIAASGLIYWWPRAARFRQALRITTDRGTRRLLRDLHVFGGALVAVLLLLSTLTGVLMCYEVPIQRELRHLGLAVSTSPPAPAHAPAPGGSTNAAPPPAAFISAQQAADAALAAYPDYDVVLLLPPVSGRPRYSLQLFPRHVSRVWRTVEAQVDASSGRVVSAFDPQRQPWGNNLVLWLIFFHNGQMFGVTGQAIVLGLGLVLLGLSLSGPWIWFLGRRANQRTRSTAPSVTLTPPMKDSNLGAT
jgi:uncharacterized iron-regulated membrane protein